MNLLIESCEHKLHRKCYQSSLLPVGLLALEEVRALQGHPGIQAAGLAVREDGRCAAQSHICLQVPAGDTWTDRQIGRCVSICDQSCNVISCH